MHKRRAEFEILPQQADQIETEALFSAAYGGVGSGKTFGAQWKMFRRLRKYPLAGHYVVGADFEQLRGGYFLDFRNMLEDLLNWKEGVDFRYRDSPRPTIIMVDSGARIRALSSELAERIRSTQIQSCHAEEPQTWKSGEQVWQTLVGRMRHSTRSAQAYPDMPIQAWLTFNPGGNPGAPIGSWLHKLITQKWLGKYPSWRFDLEDNYLLENAAQYIQNLKDNLPAHLWPVEINGNWPSSGGGVYRAFDIVAMSQEHDKLPPIAYDRRVPLMLAIDFNVHKMCAGIMQPFRQKMVSLGFDHSNLAKLPIERKKPEVDGYQQYLVTAIDEIVLRNAGAEDIADEFLKRYLRDDPYVYVYGDASGGNRSHVMSASSTVRSAWEAIIDKFDRAGLRYEMRVENGNGAVLDRVNYTNAVFRSDEGLGFRVDPVACPEMCADFQGVNFLEGKNEIDKRDPERTHMSDAVSYCLYLERRYRRNEPVTLKTFIPR